MQEAAPRLAENPEEALAALPEDVLRSLGREVVLASLHRDLIYVLPAFEAREEILAFLRLVAPELTAPEDPARPPSPSFFPPDLK
jgi:hypothetical protein